MKKILITTAIAGALLFNGVSAEAHCPHKHKPCMHVKNEQRKFDKKKNGIYIYKFLW